MNNKAPHSPNKYRPTERRSADADRLNVFYRLERDTIKPLLVMLDSLFDNLDEIKKIRENPLGFL